MRGRASQSNSRLPPARRQQKDRTKSRICQSGTQQVENRSRIGSQRSRNSTQRSRKGRESRARGRFEVAVCCGQSLPNVQMSHFARLARPRDRPARQPSRPREGRDRQVRPPARSGCRRSRAGSGKGSPCPCAARQVRCRRMQRSMGVRASILRSRSDSSSAIAFAGSAGILPAFFLASARRHGAAALRRLGGCGCAPTPGQTPILLHTSFSGGQRGKRPEGATARARGASPDAVVGALGSR